MFADHLRHQPPEVVKNGLVLWLDGQDFHNNRATNLWYDRVRSDYNPENMVKYNPVTWSEWVKAANVAGDITGLEFTYSDTVEAKAYMDSLAFKNSTKYGFLVNVVSNTLTVKTLQMDAYLTGSTVTMVTAGQTGNIKKTFTTQAAITTNRLYLKRNTAGDNGKKIKLKDIRVFELPAGSQIESDFTNLTADQLAIKYPMQSAALPYNFGYTAASGSDHVGGVVFDGVDDYCEILNSSSLCPSEITILATVDTSSGEATADILSKLNAYSLAILATGGKKLEARINADPLSNTASSIMPDGKCHIGMRYNSSQGHIDLFINGSEPTYNAQPAYSTAINVNSNNVLIGKTVIEGYLSGVVRNVQIYNRALTDQEIMQDYLATRG